jgi:hypothetical protein
MSVLDLIESLKTALNPERMRMAPDQKTLWLAEIWQEVHAVISNDAYFRLWLKAQEATKAPYGPISNNHQWICHL